MRVEVNGTWADGRKRNILPIDGNWKSLAETKADEGIADGNFLNLDGLRLNDGLDGSDGFCVSIFI